MAQTELLIPIDRSEITKEVSMTDTLTLAAVNRVCNVSISADKTLTLPPVKAAAGHIFTIFGTSVTGHTLTIQRNSDDELPYNLLRSNAGNSIEIDADDEYVVLYSDGYYWHAIAENAT